MSHSIRHIVLLTLCAAAGNFIQSARAQSESTASRRITPSVFVGLTGVHTGLNAGRNVSITAGVDIAFRPNSFLHPAIEYRGMYAIDRGQVDSLKSNLGGLNLFTRFGRFRPYADLLAGRGETTYGVGGYQVPNKLIFYTRSSSNVLSLGGGTDVFTNDHLALKVDVQLQRYSSPVTASGHLCSETGTIGFAYVFHVGRTVR